MTPTLLTALPACVALAAGPSTPSPAQAYAQRALALLARAQADTGRLLAPAETAAERLAAAGRLWLAGSHPGFVAEGHYRAGGLIGAQRLKSPEELREGDVVLCGTLDPANEADLTLARAAGEAGACCVAFAPEAADSPLATEADACFTAAAPIPREGELPTASVGMMADLWAFTGELVAALTRRARVPAMFQSVGTPGGRERNEPLLGSMFHPGVTVPPIPPGELSATYLSRVTRRLREMADDEEPRFAEAGLLAAQALADGRTIYAVPFGHCLPHEMRLPGDPGYCEVLPGQPSAELLREKLREGDVVLYVGYYFLQPEVRDIAQERGAHVVSLVCGTPDSAAAEQGAAINIDTHWPFGDTSIDLPGYDVAILPPSGVIMASAYWMLMAELQAARR